jgi:hypothetical protein
MCPVAPLAPLVPPLITGHLLTPRRLRATVSHTVRAVLFVSWAVVIRYRSSAPDGVSLNSCALDDGRAQPAAGVASRQRFHVRGLPDPGAWVAWANDGVVSVHCIYPSPHENEGSAAEGMPDRQNAALQSTAHAPPTADDEIVELLADVSTPSRLEQLLPAEPDAAFDAAVASPAVMDVAVASGSSTVNDSLPPPLPRPPIAEVHPAVPRGRGESIKRRRRSRKPGDQRRESQ